MSRVVITAAGVVSPLGSGQDEFFAGLHAGRRGIDHIRNFDTRFFPTRFGAEARKNGEVIASDHATDRKALFVRTAMAELAASATLERYAPAQRFLSLGVGIDYFDFPGYVAAGNTARWGDFSAKSKDVVDGLAEDYAIRGGHLANASACVASSQAIGLGLRLLRQYPQATAICGGFDSMLSHLHYMGFYNLGALSEWQGEPGGACRPFDRKRCGLVIGEGAAVFQLENEAQADPARVLCRIDGYASTMDAYMVTDPAPDGALLAAAALAAIRDAGLTPAQIDAVDLHGTGTVKNALAEAQALALVFPERYREIPVFALKGQIGHLIGACGAVEILGVIDALCHQRILPSVNCDEPDPDIPLNIIRERPLALRLRHVLKLNAAFGGQNTALVLSAPHPEA